MILAVAILFIASPYVAYKLRDWAGLLARVPEPLEVAAVEYRLEESWGIGGPGDNETGFVVYRLSEFSAKWARSRVTNLSSLLPGGADAWRPTPVGEAGDHDEWHPYDNDPSWNLRSEPHPPTIAEFQEKYGHLIDIEKGADSEANLAIQTKGSFYSYGRGGSVTVVDPARGKVYCAYAG